MFDGHFRTGVDKRTGPLAAIVRKTGITADHLTALGLVMAGATAVVIGSGHLFIGFVCVVLCGLPDLLDGPVAKASGTQSVRGAYFDSTADRISDALVLGGVAWHLQNARGGHWAMLAFAILGASTLISYQRAKAESLGFDAKGGLMERAERIIALCIGLAIPFLLVPVLWLMLALTLVTAVQRFIKVWRQATVAREAELAERGVTLAPRRFRASSTDRPGTTEDRWLAWRAANGAESRAAAREARAKRRSDRLEAAEKARGATELTPLGVRWRERQAERKSRPPRTRP